MSFFDGEDGQIQAETMEITVALICQISCQTETYIRIKKQVDHILHRHEILFTGIHRKLHSLSSSSIETDFIHRQDMLDDLLCFDLRKIFDHLVENNQITWGKILTILAFSTFVAKKHMDISDRIAFVTGQYIVKKLTPWIKEHGGWDSMALLESPYDLDNLSKLLTFTLTCIGLSLIGLFLVLRH